MNLLVPIAGGTIELRDYHNTNKWLSSDYTLSDPGSGSNKKVMTWTETIEPFRAMKYPVTQQLYHYVLNKEEVEPSVRNLPITEVSWLDSVVFCNEPESLAGRNAIPSPVKARIRYITTKLMAFDYYRMLSGKMRAEREPRDTGMQELIKLHGIKRTPMDPFIQ